MKIAIAGAGLVGRLLAWYCLQQGYSVSLFDSDTINGTQSCASASAGMIAPLTELINAEPLIYQYGCQALQLWPEIVASLQQPELFKQNGCLLLAQQIQQLSFVQRVLNEKLENGREINIINSDAINDLEPELKPGNKAIYFDDHAQIDSIALLNTLAEKLKQNGVQWFSEQRVSHCYPRQIIIENETVDFDWVCDCRGLGAKVDWPELRAVRGELIWLHAPEVNIKRYIGLLHPRYPLYIVPRDNHVYLMGASSIESADHSPISVRSCLELLTAAYSVHPGFAEARIIKTVVNCRPAFADNLPRIEMEKGLIKINGLYRHGFLLAPGLVKQAMEYIND